MLSVEDLKNIIKELELWIKQYVNKSGAKGIVIGNSGGKDSATVIALATKAIRERECFNCCYAMSI